MAVSLAGRLRLAFRHPVAHNALALYGVKFATFVLPLVMVPYLARVLRPAGWGLVAFAQAYGIWVWLMLEYGFNFSATREIARQREDKGRVAEIVAGVMGAKVVLACAAILVSAIVGLLIAKFRTHPVYLCWAVVYGLTQGLNPLWYFQGTEKMVNRALLDMVSRVLVTAATFWLVRTASQGWLVLVVQGLGGLISTTLLLLWMYREIAWHRPGLREILLALQQGWSMFVFRMATTLYTIANALILGLFVPATIVGYYVGADRTVNAAKSLFDPITQAVYPRASRLTVKDPRKAARLAWLALFLYGAFGLLLGGGLALAAPRLVPIFLGPGYGATIPVLRVLACSLPIIALGTVLGSLWVLPLGLDRQFAMVVIGAGILNILLACVLAPHWKAVGMAWSVCFSELAVVIGLIGVLLMRPTPYLSHDIATVPVQPGVL